MWQQRNRELQAQVEKLESEVKNLHEMHELEAQRHDWGKIEMMESFREEIEVMGSSTKEIGKQLKQEKTKHIR